MYRDSIYVQREKKKEKDVLGERRWRRRELAHLPQISTPSSRGFLTPCPSFLAIQGEVGRGV
jgi:hypothetical protein